MKRTRTLSGWMITFCALMLVGLISVARSAGATTVAAQTAPAAAPTAMKGALDINAATKEQLMTIPGFDDALAQKIIDGRPYRSKTELTKRKIVPLDLYNKISGKLTAKPIKKS